MNRDKSLRAAREARRIAGVKAFRAYMPRRRHVSTPSSLDGGVLRRKKQPTTI
jgi:hypothetical protein